ncbi:uncharacterized protein ACLA_049150 [Aspergillus clavatus NRRL 1]|uniref:Uncharacterized protein n=1 Tax=Aspergillus clavatus (strain ATCC 1007 / CBS 513.65 / DSM 816 / NCTC 3887 / NRRL 1 / QM 1276 / 107) TaxID=344612 RepID=A1CHT8_ASPCL|nr:uncharacterized protein ACLA_049150 [Aspergillus clavatus NRRL 1]EAW10443.1 conserved hypothetical protein [Aspergillus clavatus NRRL 1]
MSEFSIKVKKIFDLKGLRQRLSDSGWVLAAKEDLYDHYNFPTARCAGQGYEDYYNFPRARAAGEGCGRRP